MRGSNLELLHVALVVCWLVPRTSCERLLVDKHIEVDGLLHVGNENNISPAVAVPSGSSFVTQNMYVFGDATRAGGSSFDITGDGFFAGDMSGQWQIGGTRFQPAGATASGTAGATSETDIPQILPCPCENPPLVVTWSCVIAP